MANKRTDESDEVTKARDIVAAADKQEAAAAEDAVDPCECNAYGGKHRHLDRGIVGEDVIQAERKGA